MRLLTHPAVPAVLLALLLAGTPTAAPAQTTSGTPAVTDKSAAGELSFWNSIKNSNNAADYQAYLNNFPNGMFRDQALERLKKAGGATAGQPAKTKSAGSAMVSKAHHKPVVVTKLRHHPVKKKVRSSKARSAKPVHHKKVTCHHSIFSNKCVKAKSTHQTSNTLLGGGGSGGGGGGSSGGGGW